MSQELKLEAENPTEPGPSAVDREKTDTEESEDQMESSENEDSEDDSDNPDGYHPVIFLDEPDDPYHEPTDVGYLVINHGPGRNIPNFEKDGNGAYKCPEPSCEYFSGRRDHLRRHYKIHGAKQYECKLCSKKFAQRETCMNHIRTHDDRYKFRCDECRKRFSVYKQLKTHCHAKHGIELESRRAQWGWFGPDDERPLPPLPRINSRGHFW